MMRTVRNQVSKAAIDPNRTTIAIGFLKDWLASMRPAVIAVSLASVHREGNAPECSAGGASRCLNGSMPAFLGNKTAW
jgi:hypothetical protein